MQLVTHVREPGCLSDETVEAYVKGTLAGDARQAVEAHLQGCADCSTLVAELAKFHFQELPTERAAPPREPLAPGTKVLRYEITRPVGRGGGGIVYEAYDPQLRRRVGLKLVRPDAFPGLTPAGAEARLLREAQVMAQLVHPNVVAVHDAGVFEDEVFIVMDFVAGETLTRWLARERRGWREILAAFMAAGRGLAAAHAAHLVHRDFKPDNVLVDEQGRILVSDFGLARPTGAAGEGTVPATAGAVTMLAGTPGFMSPEQRAGRPADARSDQYSFCLSLFRALEGDRAGRGAKELPAVVYRALLRGLSAEPDDRFASMDELLAALGGPLAPRRSPLAWAAPALIALALAAVGVGLARRPAGRATAARTPSCGDGKLRAYVEECDDGNARDDDGCTTGCLACRADQGAFFWKPSGHCYTFHEEAATWQGAGAACAREGGHLPTYANADEAIALHRRFLAEGRRESWIGLRRDAGHAALGWISGEAWPQHLVEWWNGHHATAPGRDCTYQVSVPQPNGTGMPYLWPPAGCDERRSFICEREPWIEDPRTGHAYQVGYDRASWDVARERCAARGAHLATLDDREQHDFVARLVKVEVWLGAHDRARHRQHVWVTGAPVAFQAWGPTEPDEPRAGCIVLGVDALWHDRTCHKGYAYLCEVE